MPPANHFRHQPYRDTPPDARCEVLADPQEVLPSAPDYSQQLADACTPLRDTNLVATYLVHGTFTGNDFLGGLTELRRYLPALSESLRRVTKETVNLVAGETGNYTPEFATTFAEGLAAGTGRSIPVELFHWSSQNNHIGRADGAIGLIGELAHLAESLPADRRESSPRVLLWGHSHGGNVLALVTNLLAADQATRDEFFTAARPFFDPWWGTATDMPTWQRAQQVLAENHHPLRQLALDLVTFGTPIRYGWDSAGYQHLLHFVNHRPAPQGPPHRTRQPLHLTRLLQAADGDYIHQLGIAGTNLLPNPLAVRTLLADLQLKQLLERGLKSEWRFERFARGQRLAAEGTTLLVDYHDSHWCTPCHLAGHGAYTRRQWLPFHVRQIAQHFYPPATSQEPRG